MGIKRRFQSYTKPSMLQPAVNWMLAHAFLVLSLMFLVLEIGAYIVIINWFTIATLFNAGNLDAAYPSTEAKAFAALVKLDDLVVPVLSEQVLHENNDKLFIRKMMLLDRLRKLDSLNPDVRVKYFFQSISENDWEATFFSMKSIVRMGADALPYTIKILETGLPLHQYCSLCILAEIGDKDASDAVYKFAFDTEPSIRIKALYALERMGALPKYRKELVKFLLSGEYRDFTPQLQQYAIRLLAKMADPALDQRMQDFIEGGRPFEMRIASGYFALSLDKELVCKAFDLITEIFTDEEVRLEFLNCLKERRNEPMIQQIALEYIGKPENGLGRYIANQVFILADRNPDIVDEIKTLAKDSTSKGVQWDAAIVLCYYGDKSSYPLLEEAIREGSRKKEFSRVSKQAAIALGETQDIEALEILVRLAKDKEVQRLGRIRAIYWGLRIYGLLEGDWRLDKMGKTVYPVLKRIADNPEEPYEVRAFAHKAISGLGSSPGLTFGSKVVDLEIDRWRRPIFSGKGKHINEIIRQNLGYFDYPKI